MKERTVRIGDSDYERLRAIADRDEEPISVVIRKALKRYIHECYSESVFYKDFIVLDADAANKEQPQTR